jgi:hypothetical protein
MRTFQRKEVLQITGIELERFNAWVDRGYINASVEIKKGLRTFREFSVEDIYTIAAFRFMIEKCEIPRDVAGQAAGAWRDFITKHPRGKKIFVIGVCVFEKETAKKYAVSAPLIDDRGVLFPPTVYFGGSEGWEWSHTFFINLKDIVRDIDSKL